MLVREAVVAAATNAVRIGSQIPTPTEALPVALGEDFKVEAVEMTEFTAGVVQVGKGFLALALAVVLLAVELVMTDVLVTEDAEA